MLIPKDVYHKIYDLLEEYADAKPWNRDEFILNFVDEKNDEYICCDAFGNGGKFCNKGCKLYVTYHPEDETNEIFYAVASLNTLLDKLLEDYLMMRI